MFLKPFSFSGRIRRLEFGLSYVIIFFISLIFLFALGPFYLPFSIFSFIFGVIANWFLLAQGVKRSHDLGNSGWYTFIPFYGLLLLFADGEWGPNKYGPNPKGIEAPPALAINQRRAKPQNTEDKKSNHALFFWLGIVVITILFLMIRSVAFQVTEFTKMIEKSNKAREQRHTSQIELNQIEELDEIKEVKATNNKTTKLTSDSETNNKAKAVSNNAYAEPECPVVYSIQILASAKRLPLNASEFKNIKYDIEEKYFPDEKIYKYKYVVGKECSRAKIRKLQKKLRKLGFKGAFIVKR